MTSDPLANDLDCFGHPVVVLNLIRDKPAAALSIRVSEVSPATGAVHLVSTLSKTFATGMEVRPIRWPPECPPGPIPRVWI
ncbi:MAG: hypothetical protein K4571_13595 [Deltaproteobacteria bacterium]